MGKGGLVDDATVIGPAPRAPGRRRTAGTATSSTAFPGRSPRPTASTPSTRTGPEIVFDLRVSDEAVLARLADRRTCPNCEAIYHLVNKPPQDARRLRRLRRGPRPAQRRHARGHPGAAQDLSCQDRAPDRPLRGQGRSPWRRRQRPGEAEIRGVRGSSTRCSGARTGRGSDHDHLKTDAEIEAMRQSSRIVATVLAELEPLIRPGRPDARPRPLRREADPGARRRAGLQGLPRLSRLRSASRSTRRSSTASPRAGILQEGDIVSLDFGVLFEGFYGDAALTAPVGRIAPEALELIAAAERSFAKGLEQMKEGNRLRTSRRPSRQYVESRGLLGHPPVRRPRHRPGPPRGAPGPQLRAPRARAQDPAGPDPGHRADDRRRRLGGRDPGGRLDGRHQGPAAWPPTTSTPWP